MKINFSSFLIASGVASKISIHAKDAEKVSWTHLTKTITEGDTEIRLDQPTGWEVGDVIVISPSDFDAGEAEQRTIKSISNDGKTVTVETPLKYNHFGEMQTYNNGSESWNIDLRAEVSLLSRNITIRGDEESDRDGNGRSRAVHKRRRILQNGSFRGSREVPCSLAHDRR
jgi:hypothetical protein